MEININLEIQIELFLENYRKLRLFDDAHDSDIFNYELIDTDKQKVVVWSSQETNKMWLFWKSAFPSFQLNELKKDLIRNLNDKYEEANSKYKESTHSYYEGSADAYGVAEHIVETVFSSKTFK